MFEVLIDDASIAIRQLEEDRQSQYLRRVTFRAVFAFLEGSSHIFRHEARSELRSDAARHNLSEKEQSAIWERKQKDGATIPIHIPLEESLKIPFRVLAKVWSLDVELNTDGQEYEAFLAAKNARDRLTHPRTYYDTQVTDEDMSNLAQTYLWYKRAFENLWRERVKRQIELLPTEEDKEIFRKEFLGKDV